MPTLDGRWRTRTKLSSFAHLWCKYIYRERERNLKFRLKPWDTHDYIVMVIRTVIIFHTSYIFFAYLQTCCMSQKNPSAFWDVHDIVRFFEKASQVRWCYLRIQLQWCALWRACSRYPLGFNLEDWPFLGSIGWKTRRETEVFFFLEIELHLPLC